MACGGGGAAGRGMKQFSVDVRTLYIAPGALLPFTHPCAVDRGLVGGGGVPGGRRESGVTIPGLPRFTVGDGGSWRAITGRVEARGEKG